jgi:hypothetical protein
MSYIYWNHVRIFRLNQNNKYPKNRQPGCCQSLNEMFSWQNMVYDPTLIVSENKEDKSYIIASVSKSKDFILAYMPTGRPFTLNASGLQPETVFSYWFNPRSGKIKYIGKDKVTSAMEFKPWAEGWGSDFILIVTNKKLNKD